MTIEVNDVHPETAALLPGAGRRRDDGTRGLLVERKLVGQQRYRRQRQ
jgi:hypothetical protein